MANPRKATLSLFYKGERFDKNILGRITSFSYTDFASGASDAINLSLCNIDKEWLRDWEPEEGDAITSITANIITSNWEEPGETESFYCGTFNIDDATFSGWPLTCNIGAVSAPAQTDFMSTPKDKTWYRTTIREIATKISTDAGLALYYRADTIQIRSVEQSAETDSKFLYELCESYGLAMKIYKSKLVIFDIAAYEQKEAVKTIDERNILSWSHNRSNISKYTGALVKFTRPSSGTTITFQVGTNERLFYLNARADNRYDAEVQARAKIASLNRSLNTMQMKVVSDTAIVASSVIIINSLGDIDGYYYVDKVKHDISASGGYTMTLTTHKIIGRKLESGSKWYKDNYVNYSAAADSAPVDNKKAEKYTIKSADTLWQIAREKYGSGTQYQKIYNANVDVIEAAAKAHGKSSSQNGTYIYAGTVIVLPE